MASIQVVVDKDGETVELPFSECLLDALDESEDQIRVNIKYCENRLTFAKGCSIPQSTGYECYVSVLKHSALCPLRLVKTQQAAETIIAQMKISNRKIKVAVAILLQSADNFVLLTKRPAHMRTFPNCWVPPGGHVEPQESLQSAVLRELTEEIGVELDSASYSLNVLGVWESAYPPVLEWGTPNRHHLVIYFHCITKESREDIQKRIKLDPDEVAASLWLNSTHATILTNSTDITDLTKTIPSFEATIVSPTEEQSVCELPTEELFSVDGFEGRITVGTKFALEEWIKDLAVKHSFLSGSDKSAPSGLVSQL